MKLRFQQRFFSWLDSYDVYNEWNEVVYTVKGQLAWGHCLKIFDAQGRELGELREKLFTWLPKFEMYVGGAYFGRITKELTLFRPKFDIDCNGWYIQGDFFEWDYQILAPDGGLVASVSKELNIRDVYVIDVARPEDALQALLVVMAIDAEKCSRS